MNELERPEKCSETDCNNKAYKKNYLLPKVWHWVCRKHYKQFG